MAFSTGLEYLCPSACITLREGIEELRTAEGDEDAAENWASELADVLEAHDAIHVLFACSTDLTGEISAHLWKIFGTTMSMAEMHRVNRHADHQQVLSSIGHRKLILRWLKLVPQVAITLFRAAKMRRRWPVEDYVLFLDTPLSEIRQQFGICLPPQRTLQNSLKNGGAAVRHVRTRVSSL